jgi:hypothetical protein
VPRCVPTLMYSHFPCSFGTEACSFLPAFVAMSPQDPPAGPRPPPIANREASHEAPDGGGDGIGAD